MEHCSSGPYGSRRRSGSGSGSRSGSRSRSGGRSSDCDKHFCIFSDTFPPIPAMPLVGGAVQADEAGTSRGRMTAYAFFVQVRQGATILDP